MKINEIITESEVNDKPLGSQFIKDYMTQYHLKPGETLHPDYEKHLDSFDKFELKKIPLDTIQSELSGLDKAKVQQYTKQTTTSAPPIVFNGTDGHILDGYHRVNAAKARGDTHIMGYVGTRKPPPPAPAIIKTGSSGGGMAGGVSDTRDLQLGAELDPKRMMQKY
jgi:hypothetical protein